MARANGLLDRRQRYLLYKLWALLSLVRWYSILAIALPLYLSAVYIFHPGQPVLSVLMDWRLHAEIAALCLFIASGYIINAFYDVEKDLINRPQRTFFDRHISRGFSFRLYFAFNTIALILSLIVGWKVAVVNLSFSVVLWFYSHKMRSRPVHSEIGVAMLTVAPFFSLSVYYWDLTRKMFEYVAFIFILIVARGVVKKLMGMKGDIIFGDRSIAVVFGEIKARYIVVALALLSIGQIIFFIRFLVTGPVQYYFAAVIVVQAVIAAMMSRQSPDYVMVNRLFKLLLASAIFSIPFI